MSLNKNIPAKEAEEVAKDFINKLTLYTNKIEIAGSLRRRHEVVGDIEIVAEPRLVWQKNSALTGTLDYFYFKELEVDKDENLTCFNYTHERMKELLQYGLINLNRISKDGKKAPFGKRYYRINYIYKEKEYPIDFFVAVPPADYYVILLLRTGSADFSHWIVQCNPHVKFRDGHLEVDGKPVYVRSEEEIFDILGIPYRKPEERDVVDWKVVRNGL